MHMTLAHDFQALLAHIAVYGNAILGGFFSVGVGAAEAQRAEQPTSLLTLFLVFCRNVSERRPAENRDTPSFCSLGYDVKDCS